MTNTTPPWGPVRPTPPRATPADFERAARLIGCTPAEIRAVWKVEAAGRPFRADGSVERRFEPHHFPKTLWRQLGFTVNAGEAPWRASVRQSNNAMANRAYELNGDAMLTASSWGAPQIMGFNAGDAGHITARNMVSAMAQGEAAHLDAFVTLINKWGLAPAIRAHDWERFARRYNGPGQVKHYAGLLERAFRVTSTQKHAAALEAATRAETGQPSRVVLRIGSEGADVAKLQRMLGIEEDRVFGAATERAVRQFQQANGLLVDGVVGNRTWKSLEVNGETVAAVNVQPTSAATPIATKTATIASPTVAAAGLMAAVNPNATTAAVAVGVAVVAIAVLAVLLWRRSRR